jgi:enterobactin synthetase component D
MPVNMSSPLRELYPGGVVAAELRDPGDLASLLPAEAACLGRAVPARAREFAAGRQCARSALAQFGIADFPLRAASDRQPLWPRGMTGSITHTVGLCAAVVGERARVGMLGLDSEVVGAISEELWPAICMPRERAWLDSLPPAERAGGVTLLFSAKESFYKAQYPLVSQSLDFHDLEVEVREWGGLKGGFEVRATRSIAIAERNPGPLTGQYLFHEQYASAGVALPEAALEPQ